MKFKHCSLILAAFAMVGCSEPHSDLDVYITQVKSRPSGRVEPLPTFAPYETFVYAASGERSPFEPPITAEQLLANLSVAVSEVQPPTDHVPQALERFSIADLNMIGHMERGGVLVALIKDRQGSVHRVTIGDYMGKNYGKIAAITANTIELIEIVPNGPRSWMERPRTITLTGLD